MAALDFPNPPLTVGQTYAGTNGITYTWDGTVWTVPQGGTDLWVISGSTLTPVDVTKRVNVPGPTASGADQSQIQLGTRTMKGRLQSLPGVDWFGLVFNRFYNGTAWVQEDATKASWDLQMGGSDGFTIERQAPAGAPTTLLNLDNAGTMTLQAVDGQHGLMNVRATGVAGSYGIASFKGTGFRGTNASPTPAAIGDFICQVTAIGCNAAGALSEQGLLRFLAVENWSGTARGTRCDLWLTNSGSTTAANTHQFAQNGDITIFGNNATKNTGTVWINPSDIRLKKNIAKYARGLAEILQLEPISYTLKQNDIDTCGFDAEQVRDVFPECVSTTRMKLDPTDEEETDDVLVFDMHPILVALVGAMKEVGARLAALEAR